jgi:hypothetical protein
MEKDNTGKIIVSIIGGVLFLIIAFMWIMPIYNVWSARQAGKATLAHADFERQTQVVNAQANLEAQKFNAEAEVVRANGVAQANNAIKDSITEMYVKYLWVSTLDKTNNQIIYVPLGSDGLPISEAGRAVKQ